MNRILVVLFAVVLAGCQKAEPPAVEEQAPAETAESAAQEALSLAAVLDAQPDEVKARYEYRNPEETLAFFGIEPGMVVVEGLPGRGWYSGILLSYLGPDGCLIAANYPLDVWERFPFASEEFMADMANWETNFRNDAAEWVSEGRAAVETFWFGAMSDSYAGTADVVFFPRVLHNLARFENEGVGDYLSTTLKDAYDVLKPGGVFGVVQHHARDDMSDEFARGGNGYLKKAWLIEQIEAVGFEFVAESDINANPLDIPGESDVVWRLPPNYNGTGNDPEMKAAVDAIGESNRMTLKFRKPE